MVVLIVGWFVNGIFMVGVKILICVVLVGFFGGKIKVDFEKLNFCVMCCRFFLGRVVVFGMIVSWLFLKVLEEKIL